MEFISLVSRLHESPCSALNSFEVRVALDELIHQLYQCKAIHMLEVVPHFIRMMNDFSCKNQELANESLRQIMNAKLEIVVSHMQPQAMLLNAFRYQKVMLKGEKNSEEALSAFQKNYDFVQQCVTIQHDKYIYEDLLVNITKLNQSVVPNIV